MKFLIIRFSSIGDIVLTTPVIRCLKKQVPGAEVHFLTKKNFAGILRPNPYVQKLHLLDNNMPALLKTLQAENFDYVIDLHHNLRTLRVKKALQAKTFSFDKLNLQKMLLTSLKINRLPPVHIVDRCLDTAKGFGVTNDGEGLDFFLTPEEGDATTRLPATHRQGYIGVVIGAALATKQLPLHKLQQLCGLINYPLVLLGGPEDRAAGESIAAIDPHKIYNACGVYKLGESACLVKNSALIITHDTGLMHIAAAFKKPIISIWGNTVPEFGMTPYFGKYAPPHQVFQIPNKRFQEAWPGQPSIGCRPCSKIGYKKCPKGHFKCMELQDMEKIAFLAQQWLSLL